MENFNIIQSRLSELLTVAGKVQDKENTSIFISLEDFSAQKYYLYCSNPVWQCYLNLKSEGKRFIELSNAEFLKIQQKHIN